MYILVGSATTAARLKKAIEKNIGFPVYVVHTPSALNRGGCSYSLRLDDRMMEDAKRIARDNNIRIKNIYIEKTENGESVYHAVS